eukprot:4299132-Pyramimonas_sp.AAC.1
MEGAEDLSPRSVTGEKRQRSNPSNMFRSRSICGIMSKCQNVFARRTCVPDLGKSGAPELPISGSPELRSSGSPDLGKM